MSALPVPPTPDPAAGPAEDNPAIDPPTLRPPPDPPVPEVSGEWTATQNAPPLLGPIDAGTAMSSAGRHSDRPLSAPGYRLVRELGRGTFGTVWLAEDERTGTRVAIKFFTFGALSPGAWPADRGGPSTTRSRLWDEAHTLSVLDTTFGIIPLKRIEPDADPPYYVMSYAEGGSLARKLAQGPLPPAEALRVFTAIAEALGFCHTDGIVHGDLKPGNILFNQRGQPLLSDFGQAARAGRGPPALGTFFYMPPEQADLSASAPDPRWDVYALGALGYAMLTGRPPHRPALDDGLPTDKDIEPRLRAYREQLRAAAPPAAHRAVPEVDRRFADVIDRCLSVDPDRRPTDAGAVEQMLRPSPSIATPIDPPLLFQTEVETRSVRFPAERTPVSSAARADQPTRSAPTPTKWSADVAPAPDPRPSRVLYAAAGLAVGGLLIFGILAALDFFRAPAQNGVVEQTAAHQRELARIAAREVQQQWGMRASALARRAGDPAFVAAVVALADARRTARPEDWTNPAIASRERDFIALLLRPQPDDGLFPAGLTVADDKGYVLTWVDANGRGPTTADDFRRLAIPVADQDWFRHGAAGPRLSRPHAGPAGPADFQVTLAVPLQTGDGKLVGVLAGGCPLRSIAAWLRDAGLPAEATAIYDGDAACLVHPDRTAGAAAAEPLAAPDSLPRPDGPAEGSLTDYRDPVTVRGGYMAGFAWFDPLPKAPAPGRRWLVVVRRDRAAVE